MLKKKSIRIDVYDMYIGVICCTPQECYDHFKDEFDIDPFPGDEIETYSDACVVITKENAIIWISSDISRDTLERVLVHEAVHLVGHINDHKLNLGYSFESETFAYLTEYIFSELYKLALEWRKRPKSKKKQK